MAFTRIVAVVGIAIWTVVLACGGNTPPGEVKDSEVRTYIRDDLARYLDSLAYQVCILKYKVDPAGPGQDICHGPPDGYKPPPPDGKP
jgi:hypothetical protein